MKSVIRPYRGGLNAFHTLDMPESGLLGGAQMFPYWDMHALPEIPKSPTLFDPAAFPVVRVHSGATDET